MHTDFYFPILTLLLFVAEESYFLIARKYHIFDRISERGSNKLVTLCGGGIIFYIAALLYMLLIPGQWHDHALFFVALTMVSCISFIDDIKEVRQIYRLLVQMLAVLIIFMQWDVFSLQQWWFILLLLIFCTGTINAYNFMDGINGMTAAYSVVTLISISYIDKYLLPIPVVPLDMVHTMTFAVLVFAFYNFRTTARCLAGDVGSVSIAFFIVYALGYIILTTGDYYYLALLLVYGIDSVLTIIHRLILRENIVQPHRKHIYQILANEMRWKHLSVSTLYMLVQASVNIGLFIIPDNVRYYYVAACAVILSAAYIIFIYKYFPRNKAPLS